MQSSKRYRSDSTHFETLEKRHFQEAVDCLTYQFTNEEPLTKALYIEPFEFSEIMKSICEKAIEEQLSVCAVDKETGKMKGVFICLDLQTEIPIDVHNLCPKLIPVFDLMDQMKEKYRRQNNPQIGETVESFMTAVYRQYAGQGITIGLINHAVPLWIKKGYHNVVGCLTHPVTQKIILSHPKISIFDEISVKDYEYQGKKPFADIKEISSCIFTKSESYQHIKDGQYGF